MKWIKNYENLYSITENGEVFSHRFNKCRKMHLQILTKGYIGLRLYDHFGIAKTRKLHKLIAETFMEDYTTEKQVNHIDGDKNNNHIENLELVSGKENIRHAWRLGLITKMTGESHPRAILKEKEVIEIRNIRTKTGVSYDKLAERFNVSKSTIFRICKMKNWTSVH